MYKCTKCNTIHSQKEWNEKTLGEGLEDKDEYNVEIQECDSRDSEYYGAEYLFDCPSCGESGCFEDGDIVKENGNILEDKLINTFRNYLDDIGEKYSYDDELKELVEIVRKSNSSAPDIAVGKLFRYALNN